MPGERQMMQLWNVSKKDVWTGLRTTGAKKPNEGSSEGLIESCEQESF